MSALDPHCEAIMDEYRSLLPRFEEVRKTVHRTIKQTLDDAGLLVAAIESRVKTESSLEGKLELKGSKYQSLKDLTDILGLRVITFYIDDVDKVASALERLFVIDWDNSIDKRKAHEIDSFGYLSLHYICSLPDFPYRFEVQMRTLLQHAWANMNHDTGYKSGVETELTDYRRQVQALVASGNLDEVPLDGDTFRSYLELKPFLALNRRIAAVNQAEIQDVPLMPYLVVLKGLGFKTLGDINRFIKEYGDAAYQIATYQIGLTDLDIISSSLAPQDLCIAYILKSGGGKAGVRMMFDALGGTHEANEAMAEFLVEQAKSLPFMNQ